MTGIPRVASDALSSRNAAKPSSSRIITSITTRSGCSRTAVSTASRPVGGRHDLVARVPEVMLQQAVHVNLVVGD